jgi:hypothetical protein
VLIEDSLADSDSRVSGRVAKGGRSASAAAAPHAAYTNSALAENQRPLTDLIPARRWTLAVVLLLAISVVAGLETLYLRVAIEAPLPALSGWRLLDPSQTASLASWFSTLLFGLGAAGSLLILSLRRHKVDDYRGRYRLWRWMTVLFLLASLDVATGLHRQAIQLLVEITRWPSPGSALSFWNAAFAAALAIAGLRLAVEMRRCRLALLSLLAAAVCYAASAWWTPTGVFVYDGPLGVMAQSTILLFGHLSATAAIGFYARFVYLQAQGVLPATRVARERRGLRLRRPETGDPSGAGRVKPASKTRASNQTAARRKATDLESGGDQQSPQLAKKSANVARRERTSQTVKPAVSDEEGDEELGADRKLSRSERKRLRKMQRRDRMAKAG